MTAKMLARNATIALMIAAMAATGCATHGGAQGDSKSAGGSTGCDPTIAAGVGAILGGLLASGNNRVKGAALGAGLASLACLAWNYNSEQTKTAEQVQHEYKAANRGALPTQSQVVRYDTRFDPTNKVTPGKQLTLASTIEVVQGSADTSAPVIEEEMTIVKPDGSEIKARKQANEGHGAGGYKTSFAMAMPVGVPQGDYPVRTALYVNGKKTDEKRLSMQVVAVETGEFLALLR